MAEVQAKKVVKTYHSNLPSFSFAWQEEGKKLATIRFINGLFSTDDADKQDHIEGSDGFGKFISLVPAPLSPKEAAVQKATALRATAVAANAAAKDAEAEAAQFDAAP